MIRAGRSLHAMSEETAAEAELTLSDSEERHAAPGVLRRLLSRCDPMRRCISCTEHMGDAQIIHFWSCRNACTLLILYIL